MSVSSEPARLSGFLGGVIAAILTAAAVFAATPRPLADIPIPTPGGKAINLKQYRGKVVLLAMISTDCDTCVKSVEILNRIQKELGPQGFQVVAAAGDPNAQYTLSLFLQRYRPEFPVGFLNTDQMIRIGDIGKDDHPFAPIFLFIDRKGIVRNQFFGDQPFFKQEESLTRKLVEQLLKP